MYDEAIELLEEMLTENMLSNEQKESLFKWYEKEILADYLHYVQQQATITDKEAYRSVADTLIRMKSFNGGMAIVKQLMNEYRQTYKRRPYMMKELDRVKA